MPAQLAQIVKDLRALRSGRTAVIVTAQEARFPLPTVAGDIAAMDIKTRREGADHRRADKAVEEIDLQYRAD